MTDGMGFDYPRLLRDALIDVLRFVLETAAEDGFPGDHHAFVTLDTRHPDVVLPASLRKAYPESMTVVLQHQFWDLSVDEDGFSVTLRFGGRPERIYVPFDAIEGFVDPSAGFGLQYQPVAEEDDDEDDVPSNDEDGDASEDAGSPPPEGKLISFPGKGPVAVDEPDSERED